MNALEIVKGLPSLPPNDLEDLIGACFSLLPLDYPLHEKNHKIVSKWLNNRGV